MTLLRPTAVDGRSRQTNRSSATVLDRCVDQVYALLFCSLAGVGGSESESVQLDAEDEDEDALFAWVAGWEGEDVEEWCYC